jgi:hypothetical protein
MCDQPREGICRAVTGSLQILMAWCGAVPLNSGIILGLFLAGAAGSPMHCAPMCGCFVLGQVADRMAAVPATSFCEWRRVSSATLLPYHFGRLTTYAVLGAIIGAGGGIMARVPLLSAALLLLAAGLFALQAITRIAPVPAWRLAAAHMTLRAGGQLVRWLVLNLSGGVSLPDYILGLILGLLPCGFLYAALVAAAASASPLIGATGMLAFGLGTVPVLIAVGIAGRAAGQRLHKALAIAAPATLILNAALLIGLALRVLA